MCRVVQEVDEGMAEIRLGRSEAAEPRICLGGARWLIVACRE